MAREATDYLFRCGMYEALVTTHVTDPNPQAYLIAWIFDLIMPLFSLFLIVLIAYPPAREICFPPAPLALVDSSTGGVQKPKAGVLGSHDSATGAPENHKGEAVEAEASNFVNGMAHVALSSASGKHPQNEPPAEEGTPQDSVPDPTHMALGAANARVAASGGKTDGMHFYHLCSQRTLTFHKNSLTSKH